MSHVFAPGWISTGKARMPSQSLNSPVRGASHPAGRLTRQIQRRPEVTSPNSAWPVSASTSRVSESIRKMAGQTGRSEEHTSELQSHSDLVCRLLLEKKNQQRGVLRGEAQRDALLRIPSVAEDV